MSAVEASLVLDVLMVVILAAILVYVVKRL